jgi:hypothetical protein
MAVREAPADYSLWGIVLANGLPLALALLLSWPLSVLLWPYWAQSVIIGLFNVRRMLLLERFTTDGLRVNGRVVQPTAAVRWQVALFFLAHYGMFHLVYVMFLTLQTPLPAAERGWVLLLAVVFAVSHGLSHQEHLQHDLRGGTNLGTLMFVPYLRVIPMHLTIIFGMGFLQGGSGALWLFAALKTAADAAMHKVEHHLMRASCAVPDENESS